MLGLRLFYVAMRTLVFKLPHLLVVAFLPTLLALFAGIWLLNITDRLIVSYSPMAVLFDFAVFFVVPVPFVSWFAFNWHSVVIFSERPWPFPQKVMTKLWRHLLCLIALVIMLFIAITAVVYAIGAVIDSFDLAFVNNVLAPIVIFLALLAGYMLITYLFLRLAPVLASIADKTPLTFRACWFQTRSIQPAIFVISATILVVTIGLIFLIEALTSFPDIGLLVIYWLFLLIWIAVITELYSYIRAQNDVKEVFE